MTAALALSLLLAGPTSPQGIRWEKSFDKAMKKAAKHDKPLIVDFWAEWCSWCHRLDRTTYVDPVVTEKARSFVAVKVNAEGSRREMEIAEEYRVVSLPAILFLSPRGRQVLRVNSFVGPGRFPFVMDKALAVAHRVSAWEEALEKDPDEAAALSALGRHLFEQEYYEESEKLLARAAGNDCNRPAHERRESRLLLAMLRNAHRRYAEAETLIKEALTLDPEGADQPKLLFMLGHTYVSWGRRDMGMETLQVIVEKHPQSPVAQKAREKLIVLERK
jgi:thioredoxin-like negative regulator of GroEL